MTPLAGGEEHLHPTAGRGAPAQVLQRRETPLSPCDFHSSGIRTYMKTHTAGGVSQLFPEVQEDEKLQQLFV